ncbi:sugar transferase [Pseudogracilibacillus sp. SO30301A]|uniref:sugar transferase n=1 Tax=Pseudogracilibacillus sp. SO30301A TaxID=3098291 RepID=UPI003FA7B033
MYKKNIKRVFDILIILLFSLPTVLIGTIIAILIKIDSKGSIFYKQERLGFKGKVFEIYKFRTMVENAENIGSGIKTFQDDPRITTIGKFLRKTSLDEIPQLINVLKGDMSIIGPRPPVPYHPRKYQEYRKEQVKRFTVRPGITGYAQIKGRNNISWDERIVYDIEYVNNLSFLLDIKIFILTIVKVFKKEGIHSNTKEEIHSNTK